MFPTLQHTLTLSPDADLEAWRLTVPARAACFVLEDAAGRPQLLATTGNLRNTLVRRFTQASDEPGASRRVDYRAVIRTIRYRPVFSRFEANWAYLENARLLYPRQFRRMLRHRRAAWIHIDRAAAHPRFLASEEPCGDPAACFGPFITMKTARAAVQLIEDLFDLCREYAILTQAPRGLACSYKQMGRCPAPCDGSVSMDHYRRQIDDALTFLRGDRQPFLTAATQRMKQAAAELSFERAALIKGQIEKARAAPPVRSVAECRYVVLQRGQRKGRVRVWHVEGGNITFLGEMLSRWREEQIAWLADQIAARNAAPPAGHETPDDAAAQRINLVGWHLVGSDRDPGIYLPAERAADTAQLRLALDELQEKIARRRRTDGVVTEHES